MKHGTKNSISRHSFNWSSSYEELTKPDNSGFYLRNKCLFWQGTTDFQLPLVIRTAIWQLAILTKHIVEWKAVVQIFVDTLNFFIHWRTDSKIPFSHTHTFLTVRKIHYSHYIITTVTMATMTAIVHTVCRVPTRVPLLLLRHKSMPPPRYYSLLYEVLRPLAGQYYAQYYCLEWILCNVFFSL